MMLTYGFSQAATNRRVISARGWSKLECTEATHRSNPARKSPSQSTDPSGAMLSSVPCSSSSGAVEGPHLVALGQHLLVGHPLEEQVRRVVGDRVVLVPPPGRRGHHVLQAGHPVGQVGVRVQVTVQIFFPNEPWYLTPGRRLDLAVVLAHRGRYPGQAQPGVDLLLGARDDQVPRPDIE